MIWKRYGSNILYCCFIFYIYLSIQKSIKSLDSMKHFLRDWNFARQAQLFRISVSARGELFFLLLLCLNLYIIYSIKLRKRQQKKKFTIFILNKTFRKRQWLLSSNFEQFKEKAIYFSVRTIHITIFQKKFLFCDIFTKHLDK